MYSCRLLPAVSWACTILLVGMVLPSASTRRPPQQLASESLLHDSMVEQNLQPVKFAYAWYLADDDEDIACAILVSASIVKETAPRHQADLVVVYNTDIPGKERFRRMGIKMVQVSAAAAKGESQWKESFLKLRVAELFQYERVIYFDADAFPLGSLENLFDIAQFPVELAAPRAYWLQQPFVQSGGPMVLDPRKLFFRSGLLSANEQVCGNAGQRDGLGEQPLS